MQVPLNDSDTDGTCGRRRKWIDITRRCGKEHLGVFNDVSVLAGSFGERLSDPVHCVLCTPAFSNVQQMPAAC